MSTQLDLYPLPYTAPQPPEGLYRDVDKVSIYSGTTTFNSRIDARDVFLGRRRCVICGYAIPSDVGPWQLLKHLGWAPEHIKKTPDHEPRNGLLMCANHRGAFDALTFSFTGKYILINYNSYEDSQYMSEFHGKAIGLDIKDQRAPLPLLFLAHEYMVHNHGWQDWIVNDSVVDEVDGQPFSFKRERKAPARPPVLSRASPATDAPPSDSRIVIMPPTADLVEELLAFQRTMPSWKAMQQENMGWEGTAEENIQKYVENVGVEPAE
ncbi:hypothetical protein BC826DRAFT_1052473 [Russula brevipes]|nr:hypothetical protein BC826DRAFT_1052473 [Russula brevipes]